MPLDAQTAFFSYSRDDSEFALRLAADLKAGGANVWLDQLDIQPGQRWARAVQDALNNSARFIVILSPSSVNSTNVEDEIAFALEERKTFIPVFYRDCKVPFQLRPFQYVDFRTDYARGLRVMLKTLGVDQHVAVEPAGVEDVPTISADLARLEEERKQAEKQAKLEQGRKQAAAEEARLEQPVRELLATADKTGPERIAEERRGRSSADVRPGSLSAFPAWVKIVFALGLVLAVALGLYWAAHPKQKAKTESSSPPTSSQSPSVQESSAETAANLFNGTWVRQDGDRMIIYIDADNVIHANEQMPTDKEPSYYTAKLDGTRAEYHRNKGVTGISVKRKGNVITVAFYRDDEIVGYQTVTAAADGKSMQIEGILKGEKWLPVTFLKEQGSP